MRLMTRTPHTLAFAEAIELPTNWDSEPDENDLSMSIHGMRIELQPWLVRYEPRLYSDAVRIPVDLADALHDFAEELERSFDDDLAREHFVDIFWAIKIGVLTDLKALFTAFTNSLNDTNEGVGKWNLAEVVDLFGDEPLHAIRARPFGNIDKQLIIERSTMPETFVDVDGDGR